MTKREMLPRSTHRLNDATRASSAAEAVLRSTPTAFTGVFHHGLQRAAQAILIDVVLILPGGRSISARSSPTRPAGPEAPSDGHRAAQRDVEIGKFRRGDFGGGIDRRASLAHDDLQGLTRRDFDAPAAGLTPSPMRRWRVGGGIRKMIVYHGELSPKTHTVDAHLAVSMDRDAHDLSIPSAFNRKTTEHVVEIGAHARPCHVDGVNLATGCTDDEVGDFRVQARSRSSA